MCGYVSKGDHSLHLNPGDHQKLEWGDRLIVLANDGTGLAPSCSQCLQLCSLHNAVLSGPAQYAPHVQLARVVQCQEFGMQAGNAGSALIAQNNKQQFVFTIT